MKKHRRPRRIRSLKNSGRQQRLLHGESLERRELLAADFALTASSYHNAEFPADVNVDGQLSAFDALIGINHLNATGPRRLAASTASGAEGEANPQLDVNGDGMHTPADILSTLNLLNAEGEPGPVINVTARIFERPANYPFFDDDGSSGTPPVRVNATNEIDSVGVGQDFVVKLFVQDIRSMANRDGVFSGYYDVNFDNPELASLVETLPFVNHPQATGATTPFIHNSPYGQGARPLGNATGLIDSDGDSVLDQIDVVGSFSGSLSPVGAGEFVLVEWVMTATETGTLTITPEPTTDPSDPNDAGESTAFDSGLFNQDLPVCPSAATCEGEMTFVPDAITIVQDVTAVPDVDITPEDTPLTIDVLDNDVVLMPPGAMPSLVSFTQPAGATVTRVDNGTADQTDDMLRVTPNANFNGEAIFSYTISNGAGATSSTSVTVTVQAVNDAPVNTVPGVQNTNEDTDLTINGLSVTDVDADDGSGLEVTLSVVNGTLTPGTTGGNVVGEGTATVTVTGTVAQVNAALTGLVYSPNGNFNGGDTLTISTDDTGNTGGTAGNPGANNPLTDVDAVSITVNAINDAPVNIIPAGPVTVFNTDTLTFPNRMIQTSDVEATTVEVTLSVSQGTLSLSTTNGLTVTGNNTSTVNISGSLINTNNALDALVYDPIDGFIGDDTLSMTTSDLGSSGAGGALTDTDTLTITVTPPEVPFAASDAFSVEEDSGETTLNILSNDLAPPPENSVDNILTITQINGQAVTTGQELTTVNGGTLTFNGGDVSYMPAANFFGSDTFTYTIESTPVAGDGPSTGTVTINVQAINDGPVNSVPGAQSVDEDGVLAFTGGAAIDVTDMDAGAAGLMVNLNVANGTLNVATSGGAGVTGNSSAAVVLTGTVAQVNTALAGLTYRPTANFNGSDTLTVLTDDLGNTGGLVEQPTVIARLTDTDQVPITVNAINDAPTITVPGVQDAINDVDNVLSAAEGNAIQIADIDAGNNTVQVELTFLDGTLTVANTGSLASLAGNGTDAVTMQGSVSAINAVLAAGVTYRPSTSGDTSIVVTINDLGNNGGIAGDPGANNPLSATDEVAIEVLDFVPSTIGGFVYIDSNLDGIRDANELGLEGVRISLNGTTFRNESVTRETHTDSSGFYLFPELQPGNYTLQQHQPANLIDGADSFLVPVVAAQNDQATVAIPIAGDVDSQANNFGEGSLTSPFVDIADLLASSEMRSGIVVSRDSDDTWSGFIGNGGWQGFSNPRVDTNANTLTITDASGQDRVVDLSAPDPQVPDGTYGDRVRIRHSGDGETMRLIGNAADFGLGGEGEGEEYAAAVDQIFGGAG